MVPGITETKVVEFASGACGGLIRSIEWLWENPGQKPNGLLLLRNIFYGGVGGVVLGVDPVTAFTSGLAGEYLLQTLGAKTSTAKPTTTTTVPATVETPKTQ